MHIDVTIPLRVYCTGSKTEERCGAHFELEVDIDPIALFSTGSVQIRRMGREGAAPLGWYLEPTKVALCPEHNHYPTHPPPEAEHRGTETPDAKILQRATDLQALAIGGSTEEERSTAWGLFSDLWKKYRLPDNLGLEKPLT